MLQQSSLLIREAVEALLQKKDEGKFRREFPATSLIYKMVLKKLVVISCDSLVTKRFFADQVEGDCPQPLPEIGSRSEIHNMAMRENESLVGDLVDQMRNRKLHRDKSAKMRAVEFQKSLKGGQISFLHADHEGIFVFVFAHEVVYPSLQLS